MLKRRPHIVHFSGHGTFYAARRVDARHEERAALVARADQQHAWVLAGDDCGTYGDHPPKQID
jgi:hypothetical protein